MPKKSSNKRCATARSSNQGDGAAASAESRGIERPTEHDVLQGRGGQANNWIGNKTYRAAVDARKAEYVQCERAQKTAMSRELVRNWRTSGGRFLEQDGEGLWHEIGDKKARRKTSQLLREDAPNIRKGMGLPDPQQPRSSTTTGGSALAGLPDNDNESGTDTTEDSQEEEWLPKGARSSNRRRSSSRRASATKRQQRRRSTKEGGKGNAAATTKEPDKDLGMMMANPAGPAVARRPSSPPSANKRKHRSITTTRKSSTVAKGPSSMSKRDKYLATLKNGESKKYSSATTALKNGTTIKVKTTQSKTKLPALQPPPKQQQSTTTMMMELQDCFGLPPAVASSARTTTIHEQEEERIQQQIDDKKKPSASSIEDDKKLSPLQINTSKNHDAEDQKLQASLLPAHDHKLNPTIEEDGNHQKTHHSSAAGIIMESEVEDTEPLPIIDDQNLPPMVPEAEAFGHSGTSSNNRDPSWSSMGPFLRPLLDDAGAADTSNFGLLGDLDTSDLDHFAGTSGGGYGACGAALEPLDFETHQATTSSVRANNSCWEGTMDHIMDEDNSGR